MSNEIVQQNNMPAVSSETEMMMQLIQQVALNPDIQVDKMRAIMDMKMQMFDKNAEIEFNKAMILAQQEMEPVTKTAKNTQTSSMYAKMENIAKQCKPIWTSHGFALQFGTADCPIENHYRVTCEVSHRDGFNKKYQADLPIDDEGIKGQKNKTGCHGFGSTMAYAQRYLTIMIFNITIEGQDNDGNRPQQHPDAKKTVTPADIARIRNAAKLANVDEAYVCKKAGIQRIDDLLMVRVAGCMSHLQKLAQGAAQ